MTKLPALGGADEVYEEKPGYRSRPLSSMWIFSNRGDATLEARKNILVDQRDQLVSRMKEMQESLDRLNQKIENYDRDMRKAEEHLRNLEEKRQGA